MRCDVDLGHEATPWKMVGASDHRTRSESHDRPRVVLRPRRGAAALQRLYDGTQGAVTGSPRTSPRCRAGVTSLTPKPSAGAYTMSMGPRVRARGLETRRLGRHGLAERGRHGRRSKVTTVP